MKRILVLILLVMVAQTVSIMAYTVPVFDASANMEWIKQLAQGAQQLEQLKQQLQTAKNLYDTAQYALKYQGNPGNVLGGIKDAALGGSLSSSTITGSFDHLLDNLTGTLNGSAQGISSASYQLQKLVGAPVSVEKIKSQLLAGEAPRNNLAKYQAMERLFDEQNRALQTTSKQSADLRGELASLRSQVAASQDQATTEKLNAAITSTAAALASTDATIAQLTEQMQVSTQMVQNRKMLEESAYQEAYREVSDQQRHDSAQKMHEDFQNINKTR